MTMKMDLTGTGVIALGGVAVLGVVLYKLLKALPDHLPTPGEVAGAVKKAAEETVLGIGDAVGLPRTDAARGAQAMKDGNVFEASLYMPAGDFLKESVDAGVSAAAGRPETLGGVVRSVTSNDDARIAAMLRGDPIPPARSLFHPSTWF